MVFTSATFSQDTLRHKSDSLPTKFYILENVTRDGQTMPEIALDDVDVVKRIGMRDRFQWWRYRRLVYNVQKVYPYCIVVRESLSAVNDTLVSIPDDRRRRQYLKDYEKQVFREYEDDMRSMTITQGRILIKLIDRETTNSSFELIREYRGSVSAVFWQGIARIFGTNLKEKYDPAGDDYLIERVILEIEAGRI
ncbi:MAG: DUF4294 domain-containing protein [Bacteroidales bacterium]